MISILEKLKLKYIENQYGAWYALLTLEEEKDLLYQYVKFDLIDNEFKLLPDCRKAAMRLGCYWASSEADCEYPLDFIFFGEKFILFYKMVYELASSHVYSVVYENGTNAFIF